MAPTVLREHKGIYSGDDAESESSSNESPDRLKANNWIESKPVQSKLYTVPVKEAKAQK